MTSSLGLPLFVGPPYSAANLFSASASLQPLALAPSNQSTPPPGPHGTLFCTELLPSQSSSCHGETFELQLLAFHLVLYRPRLARETALLTLQKNSLPPRFLPFPMRNHIPGKPRFNVLALLGSDVSLPRLKYRHLYNRDRNFVTAVSSSRNRPARAFRVR